MSEILQCNLVSKIFEGTLPIQSENTEEFIKQYTVALEETKGTIGVTYLFRNADNIPRLKGSSNILYIGETKYDV